MKVRDAEWRVKITKNDVLLERLHDGQVIESYRKVSHAEAAVWLAAVSQGYEPPRALRRQEKPPR